MNTRSRALCALAIVLALTGCTAGTAPVDASAPASAVPTPSATAKSPESADSTPAPTVEPVIVVAAVDVDGQHVTVSGYVAGIIEDGGTCAFVFTADGRAPVRVTQPSAADRSSTSCGTAHVPVDQLGRGTYGVVLEYQSTAGSTFASKSTRIEVP